MDSDPIKNTFILLLYFVFLVSIPFSLFAQPGQQTLTDNITTALKEEGLTGAVWAIRHVDHRDVYGYTGFRDAENQLPFTLETRFHVGSVSKSLLATGILRLVSTGNINLDDPAEKYLPGLTFSNHWANNNPVTVRHLLDHTSGLDDARLWQMFSTRIRPDTPLIKAFRPKLEVLVVRARPGSRFSYSNMGYTLLGLIIETVTGEPYETYLDRELLESLGMHDSTFAFTTQTGKDADPDLAWGHIDDGSRYPATPVMLRPAGQFTTTTTDWMQFAQFLMSDGSLNGESFINRDLMHSRGAATTTQASLAGLEVGYAMGLSKLDRYGAMGLCHSGNIVGFNALMCVYPDSGQAFVISINTDSETANYKRIHKLVADTLSFPTLPVPKSNLPAADVSDWQGLYVLQPNRFESFRYLDMVFGYASLEWKKGRLVFDPFQGLTRQLRPTGKYLLSADDRQVNSHVLLRDENNEPLLSDGYRTYAKTNPAIIYGLWFSLGLGLAGMLWFVVTGAFAIKRKGMAGFLTPQGIALTGVLGLLLPIPVFFTQSFMALGDKTPASVMLAAATVLLPLAMLVTHSRIVRNKSRNNIDTLHGMAAFCVLQWCATLYYFDLLPLRLWT